MPVFTESDVREFFDRTTQTYLSFWDSEGVLHTRFFAGPHDTDYTAAADRTSDVVAADAGIDASSHVLDVGCGCGNFLFLHFDYIGARGVWTVLSLSGFMLMQV